MKKIDICVGTDLNRNLRVRLSLMYVDDTTGDVVSERYHSVTIAPDDDPIQIRAQVEQHLSLPAKQSGIPGGPWPAIPDTIWAEVLSYREVTATPEYISAAKARRILNMKGPSNGAS